MISGGVMILNTCQTGTGERGRDRERKRERTKIICGLENMISQERLK